MEKYIGDAKVVSTNGGQKKCQNVAQIVVVGIILNPVIFAIP